MTAAYQGTSETVVCSDIEENVDYLQPGDAGIPARDVGVCTDDVRTSRSVVHVFHRGIAEPCHSFRDCSLPFTRFSTPRPIPPPPSDCGCTGCNYCSWDPSCNFWTYWEGNCYLKATDAGKTTSSGRVSGAAVNVTNPDITWAPGCADVACGNTTLFSDAVYAAKNADVIIATFGLDQASACLCLFVFVSRLIAVRFPPFATLPNPALVTHPSSTPPLPRPKHPRPDV